MEGFEIRLGFLGFMIGCWVDWFGLVWRLAFRSV